MVAARLIDVSAEGRQRIDRYELVAEIASGGMATVFLARLGGVGGFQRFVAIKRLHPHLAGEQEFVEMFLDEARLAAGIHHPNVVPILEVGASDRGYYIVMEYIEGDTLARLLARAATSGSRLPVKVGLRIVLDMLAGLHAAHELKDDRGEPTELVHRDVSPQNVLVGTDGISRITDFGVARAATRLTATRVGQLKGKIAYMAPEQATGEPNVDRRADVFSAGILLWEVLAARRLFKADNEAATLSRVISEPVADPREFATGLSEEITNVCLKALERDPEKRYPTCAQFADALERAAKPEEIASPRELAAYVAEVIGNEISQQRDAVRAWLARSEPSQVGVPEAGSLPSSSVSAGAMALPEGGSSYPTVSGVAPGSMQPPQRSRGALIGAILAGLVVVVGGVAFLATRGDGQPAEGALEHSQAAAATAGEGSETKSPSGKEAEDDGADESDSGQKAATDTPDAGEAEADAGQPAEAAQPAPKPRTWPRSTWAKPKPAPAPKPSGKSEDIDLSNPYR